MDKMKFAPGYYEWNLYLNGEIIWTCNDFSDDLPDEVNEEATCNMADLLMVQMKSDFENEGKELSDKLYVAATETIANAIKERF